MADTVTTIVDACQYDYPDMTDAKGVEYANVVHRRLLTAFPELRIDTEDINLTSGTGEYSLDEDIYKVHSALYLTAASTGTVLDETSVTELDNKNAGWRLESSGTPTGFYVWANTTGQVVGLYPKPNTTTSGGFPKVTLYVTRRPSALTGSDTVFTMLPDSQIYKEGILLEFAKAQRKEDVAMRLEVYRAELQRVGEFVRGINFRKLSDEFPDAPTKPRKP